MFGQLRKRFRRREQERHQERITDVTRMAMIIAEKNLGAVANDVDPDAILDQLEAELLTLGDFEAMVSLATQRIQWAQLAAEEESLKAEAERLVREAEEFDIREAKRHREALMVLEKMNQAAITKTNAHLQAFEARHKLFATAAPPIDQAELQQQLVEAAAKIAAIETKLNPNDLPGDASYAAAAVDRRPARAARQARAALADAIAVNSPAAHRKQIEQRISAAEAEVSRVKKELPKLRKQYESIVEQQRRKPADAMRPENMAIVRHRPTRDETMKRTAAQLGWRSE